MGLNQVVWNLRADGSTEVVPAGEYLAQLVIGARRRATSIRVDAEEPAGPAAAGKGENTPE
jgi:hypothetical protein